MLEIKNLTCGYGKRGVVKNLSCRFERGETVSIVGVNGCGKSTLLKALIRLSDKLDGQIIIDGKEVEEYSPTMLARKISYLPQSRNIPDMTVGQLVLHGRFPYLSYPRRYKRKDIEIAENAMEKMGITELCDTPLSQLSGGMRQIAYIAMALCQQSDAILLDEPTTYLDINNQLMLCDTIKNLSKSGKSVIAVMHDISLALKISDKMAVMKSGELLAFDTPEKILKSNSLKEACNIDVRSVMTDKGIQYYYSL